MYRVVTLLLCLLTLFIAPAVSADKLGDTLERHYQLAMSRCARTTAATAQIYQHDYNWDYSFSEVGELYHYIYNSGKRLPDPVYYDTKKAKFFMPVATSNADTAETINVEVSRLFLLSILNHVLTATQQNLIDYVFLADMGHGHFRIPTDIYRQKNPAGFNAEQIYQFVMHTPEAKILYHTAEMFIHYGQGSQWDALPDHVKWRYRTRNLLGDLGKIGNSTQLQILIHPNGATSGIQSVAGYLPVADDIDLSASKDGCFPFVQNGEMKFFDISAFSPRAAPENTLVECQNCDE